jgi:hypothetical protein
MFMQKGVGDAIRSRLRRVGIDLNDQSRNRELAREGSINDLLATIDLSSASDSIAYSLVESIVPIAWFSLLSGLRSPITTIDGDDHVNAMFSSMGNGFTFELESLIFYSLARATAYFMNEKGTISVYGDDIIIPASLCPDLTYVLEFCGFSVNTEKSFSSGPFRESCGGHYYYGSDITPFYLRAPLNDLTDIIHIANQIRLWSERTGFSFSTGNTSYGELNPALKSLWETLAGVVPQVLWGANEPGRAALITEHFPRKRLVSVEKKHDTGLGGYLHWHTTFWKRDTVYDGETIRLSERSSSLGKFRIRPQPLWVGNSVITRFPD